MMELQRGITGFRHVNEPHLPACDMDAFRTHCYATARLVGGRVIRSPRRPDGVEANFVMAVLDVSGVHVAVLLNYNFPVVGFAIPPGEGETGPLRFIDGDRLAEALRATGVYKVLDRAELELPVSEKDLDQLAPAEREQVKHWQPARIGDVVFNFWD